MRMMGQFSLLIGLFSFFPGSSFGGESPRILAIGDSHSVGPFGHLLSERLRAQFGSKVSLYSTCGSIASSWLTGWKTHCGYYFKNELGESVEGKVGPTPKLPALLNALDPNLLIVELSGNYSENHTEASAIDDMKQVIDLLKNPKLQCIWVSAPDSRVNSIKRAQLALWVMKAAGERCKVVNGRDYTHYPSESGDGTHYWRTADIDPWVQAVVKEAEALLN